MQFSHGWRYTISANRVIGNWTPSHIIVFTPFQAIMKANRISFQHL